MSGLVWDCFTFARSQQPTNRLKLRLVGYCDWTADEMLVYVEDSILVDPCLSQKCGKLLLDHIVTLVTHCFFGVKPARPAQARWTGVANCARFVLGLGVFFNILKPLFCGLTTKDDVDAAKNRKTTGDIDARISEYC